MGGGLIRYALAPTNRSFQNIDILESYSAGYRFGFSYREGSDSVSAFHSPTVLGGVYHSARIPFRMYELRFETKLLWDFWITGSLGRWQVHKLQKNSEPEQQAPDIVYLVSSTNTRGMQIDIEKTYASVGLSWQKVLYRNYSIGLIALEYITKGDSSGVNVNSINARHDAERARIHAAIVKYSRRDSLNPLKVFVQYDF